MIEHKPSRREEEAFRNFMERFYVAGDRMFAWLMLLQWAGAVAVAFILSPETGGDSYLHFHFYAAVILGGIFSSLPIYLIRHQPGAWINRHIVAVAQMLYSALLIHLTGGRIETHFHIFGSLAFLASYRDVGVLLTASLVTLADHFIRGTVWPETIYGTMSANPWRSFEHAGWVIFEDIFLVYSIASAIKGIRILAETQTRLEESLATVEAKVQERTQELLAAQHNLVISAKNSALGEMAGQIAHEINTPLGTIVLSAEALERKLKRDFSPAEMQTKLQFIVQVAHKMSRIINSMRKFARGNSDEMAPTSVRDLIADTLILCESRFKGHAVTFEVVNSVGDDTVVVCRAGEISQVLLNLLNNAVDAVKENPERNIELKISQEGNALRFAVSDSGKGVPQDLREKLFANAFTTKSADHGTGLGLSISRELIGRHGGRIFYDNAAPKTTFVFELPKTPPEIGMVA